MSASRVIVILAVRTTRKIPLVYFRMILDSSNLDTRQGESALAGDLRPELPESAVARPHRQEIGSVSSGQPQNLDHMQVRLRPRAVGMAIDRNLLGRMALTDAVTRELSSRNRLMPIRWDYEALTANLSAVEKWLRPQLRRGPSGSSASIVLADKGWRGTRPLHIMALEDRILYRSLVELIRAALPARLASRVPIEQFRTAPLDVPDVQYISKADVSAYYEFVDHDLLRTELIGQTGEEPAVDALSDLLASVLGRRIGLPQVHPASDVLGDTYIDPVRRRLLRQGHTVFTYSDDFRIASPSLGAARASLEACAIELRSLGLVLNERKTYTYGAEKYRRSLTSFADAERRLFAGDEAVDAFGGLGFLDSDYGDADGGDGAPWALGASPLGSNIDEDEAFATDEGVNEEIDPRRAQAAQRVWELWVEEDEDEDIQAGQEAAITQSLLGRALPILGAAGDRGPLGGLSLLLRYEPALTPQIAKYIEAFGQNGSRARADLRSALDETVTGDILSPWQEIWLAHAVGGIQRARRRHNYEDWLVQCTIDRHDGLAATAAVALGRIGRGDADRVAAVVERVGPAWRRLAFWGLIGLDRARAESTADDELDRLLLAAATEQ